MSEMELKAGKAIPINMPLNLSFAESVTHLESIGFTFDEIDLDEEWVWSNEVIHANGLWFQLKQIDINAYGCSIGTLNADNSIDYICHWYNGGASFDEVFAQAVNNAKGVSE